MTVTKILTLAANPLDTTRLRLPEEVREIQEGLALSEGREKFKVVSQWAVRPDDLRRALLKYEPQIVHFCGHGSGEEGLVLQDAAKQPVAVTTDALSNLFRLCAEHVNCVVLNACYSEVQAEAIVAHVDYAIGMRQKIGDDAAQHFAQGFYRALGYGKSVEVAYKWGCNAIQLMLSSEAKARTRDSVIPQRRKISRKAVVESGAQELPEYLKPRLFKRAALRDLKRSEVEQSSMEEAVSRQTLVGFPTSKRARFSYTRRAFFKFFKAMSFSGIGLGLIGLLRLFENRSFKNDKITEQPISIKLFKENLGNGIELEMVMIPAGNFIMGSPSNEKERHRDEGPQRQVTVPELAIGRFEVTQAQYEVVMGNNPSEFEGKRRPVETVSWEDAQEFCQKLSQRTGRTYRLPSEAEWEYACRAGTTTPFHFGKTIADNLANYDKHLGHTTDVGHFAPNAFGLHDMHGNVWEWCEDRRHLDYKDAPTDGSAWIVDPYKDKEEGYMLRGGSWDFYPDFCRSAKRFFKPSDLRNDDIGFRVVLSL